LPPALHSGRGSAGASVAGDAPGPAPGNLLCPLAGNFRTLPCGAPSVQAPKLWTPPRNSRKASDAAHPGRSRNLSGRGYNYVNCGESVFRGRLHAPNVILARKLSDVIVQLKLEQRRKYLSRRHLPLKLFEKLLQMKRLVHA